VAPLVALGLFLVWSNSFVAVSFLLGREGAPAQLDWLALAVARFVIAGSACALYCALWRRAESIAVLRGYWGRLAVCGFLAVPTYNFALFYAQQHGVTPPIASLTTTLVPLFVMALSVAFLGERLTRRRLVGFAVATIGMYVVATARRGGGGVGYPLLLAITALAPLSWSLLTVISKPVTARVSPVVWSYVSTAVGTLMVLPLLPGATWSQMTRLDAGGWAALLYLALPCVVLGFALWTWLLRHLPASTVGFTVFLNPPLTTLSKWLLALAAPAVFTFTVVAREWVGGLITLVGMGIAVSAGRQRGEGGASSRLTGVNRA
jgi:O-acetylserine/cysteine efflux transporter